MSFSPDDLAQLGEFITQRVEAGISAIKADIARGHESKSAEQAAQERTAVVGIPDVPPDAGPLYWVHLANGDVIESRDSASTHIDVNGVTVPVTGRWEVPEGAPPLLAGRYAVPEASDAPVVTQEPERAVQL
jgi:hypothetical protein